MTKKCNLFITILAMFTTICITSAKAECDGFYIAGRAGYAKYKVDDDRSGVSSSSSDYVIDKRRFMASGALGYRYEHFRGELEYIWRKKNSGGVAGITEGKFKSESYMFVVYYDFFPYTWFTPFVNAGLGYTRSKLAINMPLTDFSRHVKENGFTWSLGAGISLKITNRMNLDVGYRYYDMGDGPSADNGKTTMDNQEIYAGLRYVL